MLTCPAVVPSSLVFMAAKWSLDSSHTKPTLPEPPLFTMKPESTLPTVAPDDNNINGSFTLTFSASTVVVVPVTVKLPEIVKLPPAVRLFPPKLIVPELSTIEPEPIAKVPPTVAVVAATCPAVP